ncbi:MAG: hypothetical protein WCK98_06140 [bacterium]
MSDIKSPKQADKSTKQNLFLKTKAFFKGYRAPRYLVVSSIAFLTLTLILSAFALWSVNQSKDTANAGSTTFSGGNINHTKLYSVDGGSTWSSTVSANPGQTVKVRLWSENTGGISATSGNIKDSLPTPFTYVAGSTRNCINPSATTVTTPNTTELVCDAGTPTQKDSLYLFR